MLAPLVSQHQAYRQADEALREAEQQLAAEIQALAASLNNNPVQIYNWVHDNIEFVPTYGSIQGAQMTLQTKRGNAFDTARHTACSAGNWRWSSRASRFSTILSPSRIGRVSGRALVWSFSLPDFLGSQKSSVWPSALS